MHQYLWLIHVNDLGETRAEELRQLRACLDSAPGMESIKTIERHPRGGVSVTFEHSCDQFDSLIDYLLSHGYQPVL